ncbi:MAG: GrpB family protein [bacterium]|nr:GrpB family protein [bacterium]
MIGLKRGTVKLVPHNPKWSELFEQEKQLLKNTFGDIIIAIEHIGSTAIPGIPTKPIIDMDIGVESLEVARNMKEKFEKLGYEHRPFVPGHIKEESKWQELYVKGPEAKRTHHAHITVYGNSHWKNDLLFRDYLRKNSARAKQYAELKQELAEKYADDRETYTKNKEQLINDTLETAKKESR